MTPLNLLAIAAGKSSTANAEGILRRAHDIVVIPCVYRTHDNKALTSNDGSPLGNHSMRELMGQGGACVFPKAIPQEFICCSLLNAKSPRYRRYCLQYLKP